MHVLPICCKKFLVGQIVNSLIMKCIIAGSTGLIGGLLLNELLADNNFDEVVVLVRKEITLKNKKLKQIIFDFDNIESYKKLAKTDVIFCCLGTTIKVAKSKDNFRKVDFQYPLNLAKHVSTKAFSVVSSMGANSKSMVFYSKVKGELEEELKKLNFTSLNIYRPSQLVGKRKEIRKNEIFSEKMMTILEFLIPKNFQLINAIDVAKAMKIDALNQKEGIHVFSSAIIKQKAINEKL